MAEHEFVSADAHWLRLTPIAQAALDAMIWASVDEEDRDELGFFHGSEIDRSTYDVIVAGDWLDKFITDVDAFEVDAFEYIGGCGASLEQIGHSYGLEYIRSGCGFTDSPEKYGIDNDGNEYAKLLSQSMTHGEFSIYRGDDGNFHIYYQ